MLSLKDFSNIALCIGTFMSIIPSIIGLTYFHNFKPDTQIMSLIFFIYLGIYLIGISSGIMISTKN